VISALQVEYPAPKNLVITMPLNYHKYDGRILCQFGTLVSSPEHEVLSNFLIGEAYFAVTRWHFLHRFKGLSRTAVSQFLHLSTQTVVVEL